MRLKNIVNGNGVFTLLDFSRVSSFSDSLKLDLASYSKQFASLISVQMKYLSPEVSGVLIEPFFEFDSLDMKSSSTGLVLPLEMNSDAVDPLSLPKVIDNWGVEQIKNNYGVVKLGMHYNPLESQALAKKHFLAEVYDYCQYLGLDLLLDLSIFSLGENRLSKGDKLEMQLRAIDELSGNYDLIALEFLGDALSSVTVTASLDTSWIYSAKDIEYEQFKENLRITMESGAMGFLASNPLLFSSLLVNEQDMEKLTRVISTTLRDRVIESVRIANEATALI